MKGQEFKILFKHDLAYLSPDRPLALSELNLPEFAKYFKAPAFFIIRVINYIENERRLFCDIASYNVGETDILPNQLFFAEILNRIEKITFRSIDTSGLLNTLNSSKPVSLRPAIDKTILPEEPKQEPKVATIRETFFIPVKDVRFKLGGVSFSKKLKGYNKSIEFHISNHDIREEFDAVKNYFGNVLKTKKIEVTATVEITDNEVTSVSASSPEIDKINQQLIESVKFEFIKIAKKKVAVDVDKNLFTMDEYLDTFGEEDFKSNVFYSNEKDLFEDLLRITDTKHYKNLRYLSDRHSHQILKLRFIHKPFSYIFLIEGDRNYHLIWETLDTEEATYIWHVEKNLAALKMAVSKIEDAINLIKVQGKTAYINSTEDSVRRIYHDYSLLIDGFLKWKSELESVLT